MTYYLVRFSPVVVALGAVIVGSALRGHRAGLRAVPKVDEREP